MNRVSTTTLLGLMLVAAVRADYRIKQVAVFGSGMAGFGDVVIDDTDLDGQPEISFWSFATGEPVWFWHIWESHSFNRYELVKADTCVGIGGPNPPPGLHKGRFIPTDVGDVDGDGLPEILGVNTWYFDDSLSKHDYDSVWQLLCLYESPQQGMYPDTLVWFFNYGTNILPSPGAWCVGDLDSDGHSDIAFYDGQGHILIFESTGDNRNELVYQTPFYYFGYDLAFGDFDQDSAHEFVIAPVWSGFVYVFECTGDDQYVLTDSIPHWYPNGADVFSGNDVDQDGRPEFFIVYKSFVPVRYYVYMYEATGNNSYDGVLVDSAGLTATAQGRNSVCSDIDGDGQEEVLVSFNDFVRVYKATGDNQFECVYQWWNRASGHHESHIQSHDMNRNGYNDIVISGNSHTWILEMEAIKLLYPNGGQNLIPGATHLIQWETYDPPRCDSVSLFLRRDTTWQLDTIATGLAPNDTGYSWVVPPGPVDSCWVVAMAYGPGWQYDESDAPLSIRPGGVQEKDEGGRMKAAPATRTVVRDVLWLPGQSGDRPSCGGTVPILLDISGRRVMDLQPGENDIRYLAPGIYFVRSAERGTRSAVSVRKVLIQR
jgi:hypothetical protein